MKKSIRITALLLAVIIGVFAAADSAMAAKSSGTTQTAEAEETTAAQDEAKETVKETAAAKEKKAGNLDRFIGLDSRYWVLATGKVKIFVYSKMDKNSTVLGSFKKNNCVVVNTGSLKKGKNYKWIKVYLQNKKAGYIPLNRVSLGIIDTKTFGLNPKAAKNSTRIKVCRYGLPYIGTRFRLGGSSLTGGIDCSTFARKAMRNAGVNVRPYALAAELSNTGKALSRSQLKPGDMVFYPHNSKNLSIGHCAIYIGKGYIINASGHQGSIYPSGGIRFSRIDYRSPSAKKFRDIIGN